MSPFRPDTTESTSTIAAIGLLAYASADIAHHVVGHGGACLAFGGSIVSLSSVYVSCSVRNAAIDLAGPAANLALGLVAWFGARAAIRSSAPVRLCWILVAAFNLLWCASQLAFSAASNTDDWAWPMHQFHGTDPVRYGLTVIGALAYLAAIRACADQMAPFAHPRERARMMLRIAWLTAGVTACATAVFDHDAVHAVLMHALPQSVLTSAGLLFVPARAARVSSSGDPAGAIVRSAPWIVAAAIVGLASIVWLGPGVAIPR